MMSIDDVARRNELDALYFNEAKRLSTKLDDDGDYEHPVFGKGALSPKLMLIGEAPGDYEARLASPFVGKAGKQLDELLSLAGIMRESVYVTNAVKFRPIVRKERSVSNRTPKTFEIREALPLLEREIAIVSPRVIASLGRIPLFAMNELFFGEKLSIGEVHGQGCEFLQSGRKTILFPMYHPASAIYRRELLNTLRDDYVALASELLQIDKLE